MKKLATSILLFAAVLTAPAQSLYIHQGSVAAVANYVTAGDMTYTPTTLTVQGVAFPLNTIDSITFSHDTLNVRTVKVAYTTAAAKVYIPVTLMSLVSATVSGANVVVTSTQTEGDEITYSLSGTTTAGSFRQNGTYKCTLQLNGVNITSTTGAAVNIDNGRRIDIVAVAGTTNTFRDAATGTQKACFRVKGHAEFKGAGTINIAGNAGHAFRSGEYTSIKKSFGTLNITAAANDGMHIGQYFETNGGTINISGIRGDGIQVEYTNDATDENNGQMLLNAGTITIRSGAVNADGLKADSILKVTGGTYNVTMSGDGSKGINVQSAAVSATTSVPVFTLNATGNVYTDATGDNKKSMGLKTDADLYLHAGTFHVYATGTKAKAIKVGGNYYYTRAVTFSPIVTPDVSGAIYLISE